MSTQAISLQVGQVYELLTGRNKGRHVQIVHIERWCEESERWRVLAEDASGRSWWADAAFFVDNYRPVT